MPGGSRRGLRPPFRLGAHGAVDTWTAMFRGVPDLSGELVGDATDGTTTWSEWRWRGTHTDGTPFAMSGVVVGGLTDDGLISWLRLYMEPVEQDGAAIDETVRRLSGPG